MTHNPIYTCEVCDKKCTGDEADENNICYVPDLEEESNKIDKYELLCWSCVTKLLDCGSWYGYRAEEVNDD